MNAQQQFDLAQEYRARGQAELAWPQLWSLYDAGQTDDVVLEVLVWTGFECGEWDRVWEATRNLEAFRGLTEELRARIEATPDNPLLHLSLAGMLYRNKKNAAARRCLDEIIDQPVVRVKALELVGLTHLKCEPRLAAAAFESALDCLGAGSSPERNGLLFYLATALTRIGEKERALRLCSQLAKLEPTNRRAERLASIIIDPANYWYPDSDSNGWSFRRPNPPPPSLTEKRLPDNDT